MHFVKVEDFVSAYRNAMLFTHKKHEYNNPLDTVAHVGREHRFVSRVEEHGMNQFTHYFDFESEYDYELFLLKWA